ncbi:MAG: hypothetical protein DCC64_15820 [Planctomycetota bacterium]|nr:MAG: hypothetical protein DCC64_15820 [Planctomycetota bacterium]
MYDPNNPYRHGSALASRHDREYEDRLAREQARKDEYARILIASFSQLSPRYVAPAKVYAPAPRRDLPVSPPRQHWQGSNYSMANRAWNFVWKSCGAVLLLLLLAALAQ